MNNGLELRAGDLRLALRPDLGGSIAGLWRGDMPVLRSIEPAALEAPRLARMLPARRRTPTGSATGASAGTATTTPPRPNFERGNPHSVHGSAWHRPLAGRAPRRRRSAELASRSRPTRTGRSPSTLASVSS